MTRFGIREIVVCGATLAMSALPAFAQYALEVAVEPAGAGSVANFPAGDDFDAGTMVTLTATAADGYVFLGWEGDISATESSITFPMTDHTNLTALFGEPPAPEYTLTAYVDPSGAGSLVKDPAQVTYTEGTEVGIEAFAAEGFVFTGWVGDLPEGADPTDPYLLVEMTDDLDIAATFAAAQELEDEATTTSDDGASTAAPAGACGAIGMVGMFLTCSLMLAMKLGRGR